MGPNSQFGREKEGLCKKAYHVEMEDMVNGVASNPTTSQTTIEITNFWKAFTIFSMS